MRLVHISDLHAGKTLGNISRNEDLSYAIDQVIDFCIKNKVDTVLVAGDVFDKSNPDNSSKQLIFEDFFLRLNKNQIKTIVISGNHDSYDFFKSIKELSKLANVYIFDRPNPKDFYILLDNQVCIACLPYPSERVLTEADSTSHLAYADKVSKFLRYMESETQNFKPKILLTHLMIGGAICTRTEREVHISDYYAVPPSNLPHSFDYIALGHVHKFQRIDKAQTLAYYSGNLYQMDFSEAGQDKFLIFLEIKDKEIIKLENIKLDLKNPLRITELNQEEVFGKLEDLKRYKGYIKLIINVSNKKTLPYVIDRIKEEIWDKLPRGVEIKSDFDFKKEESLEGVEISPLSLYKQYYKKEYGEEMPEELEKAFLKLLEDSDETALS